MARARVSVSAKALLCGTRRDVFFPCFLRRRESTGLLERGGGTSGHSLYCWLFQKTRLVTATRLEMGSATPAWQIRVHWKSGIITEAPFFTRTPPHRCTEHLRNIYPSCRRSKFKQVRKPIPASSQIAILLPSLARYCDHGIQAP